MPARRSSRAAARRSTPSRRRSWCSRTIPISTPAAARSSPLRAGSRWTLRSWTGAGEYFIRVGVAHAISDAVRIGRDGAQAAADAAMADVAALGGSGGVIVVTPSGEGVFSFNTPGMYRGAASPEGRMVALYGDESA